MPSAMIPIALTMLVGAAILSFVRLLRGPTLPDRVVSVDLAGALIVGLTVVSAAVTGEEAYLDVAMVIALVSFVGTVAYARYIEGEGRP
jgi:multicomponent Na+:H+ antiporter subunit F